MCCCPNYLSGIMTCKQPLGFPSRQGTIPGTLQLLFLPFPIYALAHVSLYVLRMHRMPFNVLVDNAEIQQIATVLYPLLFSRRELKYKVSFFAFVFIKGTRSF